MRDRALAPVRQQPKVERDVIQVDGHGRDEGGDVEAAWRVDEAREDEQAQGGGGQVGDLVERAGAQQAELNPAVGRVEGQRHPREHDRIGPQPDRALLP